MSSRSCLSVTNDPYITKLGEEFGLEPVVSHAEVGAWMELNNTGDYPTRELFKKYMESQEAPVIPSYEGDIKPEPNTIFVFGSNPEGRHGLGAAKIARQQFGAIYGQGEGLQGNAYALPTKDLRVKENRGLKSISPEQITESIKTLYEVARENPDKQFKVAYRNTTKESLNGYTGLEMIEMFNAAGNRPPNIIFSKEWVDTGKIKNNYDTLKPNTSSPLMNSVLTAQDRVKKAFTAQEREERAVSIANLFSSQIDLLQEKYSQEGNPKSRLDIINLETPMGIFLKVKQFIEYAIENPEALDWSQEQIDAAQKTVDYFFDLANLSSRYLASSEGFVFTMYNKEAIPSLVSDYNELTGDDSDTNIDDPLYKEEELAEGWTIKHQHMSAKSTLSKVVRRLLARIPQIGIDGQLQRDILGFPKYLNPDLAHAVLIDKLRFMTKSRDLIPMLEDLSQTRAWVRPIIDMLEDSKSLRSKFYTDFRKDFNQFWVVNRRLNDDGSYSHKTFPVNRPMGVGYLLDEWVENYSSGTVISPNSIYDSNNRVQEDNVKANIETLKVLLSGLRELRKTSGDDFLTVATWVSENIDDIASVIQSIGVTLDKDLIELALNRRPGNVKNVLIKVNHRIGSLLNQLTTMMTTINNKNIGIDKGNTKQPVDWNKLFSKTYSSLAKILSSVTEDAIESSTFENGKSYYSHLVPNYLNKLIKRFKFTKGEEFNQFINNEFAKFHQFFDFKINQLKDGWIKDLNDDPASRELLDVLTMLNFNKVDYPDLSELDYSSAMIQQFFGANSNASAWYHMPILSDSPAGLFIKFKRYADGKDTALPMREIDRDENDNPIYQRMTYKEFLLDRFVTVAQQEYERIRLVRQREELLQKNSSLKPIDNFESRGLEFQFFPQLNNSISTIDSLYDSNDVASQVALQELYKNEINEILDNEFQKAVDQWESIGLFDKTDNGNYIHLNFKTKNEADVLAQMENYFWNSAYATTQIILMTTGDLTFYSSIEDFQKRNKLIYAPANRLDTESEYGRENQRTVILKDVYLSSNSYLNIQEALRASGLPLDLIREVMSSYVASDSTRGVNQTDALAYSSLESFRAMEDMMGEWNEAKQALYDKLLQHSKGQGPVFTANDFTALALMNSKKPFVYTLKAVDSGIVDEYGNKVYIKTPFQNKNSHYLITIAGLMARSPLFVALNDFMMNNNIDVVQFESSVKDGNQGAVDISNIDSKDQIVLVLEKNTGTEKNAPDPFLLSQTIHVIPYEDFGIQLPIDDHITDFTLLFGTQARKIIAGDLPLDPSFRINVNGKKYTRDQWIELYNNLIVENVLDSFIETRELFDSNESMEELLLSEIRSNSRYSRDLEAAVTLDSNGNFPIPLYEPAQSLQLQLLLSAVVKNRVTKQKIKGGQLVLVSNFGFSDDLSVRFKDKSGKLMPTLKDYLKRNPDKTDKDYRQYLADNQAGLAYYEAYMPAYSKDFIEDFMDPKTGEINVNALPADLRRVIGYRIPTEAHYSIVPIYIKGFLPSYAGSQIMLPADITAVTGSDFDIDKMYVMLPEYRRKTIDFALAKKDFKASKRILEAIESIFLNSDIANDLSEYPETFKEFVNNNIEKYTLDRPRYEKIRYNSKAETYQNSRAARNNLLIDMMWGVLTSPEMLPNMFMPQSFDIQKKASRIITILQNTNKKDLEKWLGGKLSDVIPKLTLQELEDLSREFVESPNIINPTSQTYFHQLNMGGAKMIGIAANHNANHALMLQTDIAIGEDVAFIFDGVIKRSLSALRNEDGELISRNVSGYLAASVDNAKDPVLKFINLNTFTADTTFLLARLGYSPLSIALFMNQPIMLDITNYYFNNRLGSESRDGLIKKFINDYKKDHSLENIDGDTLIDVSLSDLIDMMQADRNSPSFHQRQYEVALKFTEMLAAADVLSSLTSATRADTGNGGQGPSFAHTETKINKLIDYIDDNDIYGEKPLLENGDIIYPYLDLEQGDMSIEEYASHLRSQMRSSKLPMLQAFLSLGLESQEILVSKFFPHFRDDFRYVQDALRNMTFRKKLSPETMNKIYSDLFVYIMSANDYFTGGSTQAFADRFNYYTKDFVQEFKKIKSNPKYSDNELIKHLSIRRADNNNPIPSISFNNVGSLSSELKLLIMEAWADLLYQGEDGIKLANDLFIYNYFKNGFGFGPSSFMHLAPTILKVNISQYRKSLENINNQDDNVKDRYEYFIDQFLLNRTNITELVPNIQGETSFEWTDEEGNILETISVPLPKRNDPTGYVAPQGDRLFLVRFIGKEPLMKRFVTKSINGKEYVYKYIGDSRTESEFGDIENAVYARVDRLGYNNHYVQYLYGETADNLSESLDPIEPLDPTAGREFLSEQQVPKENDYILDARSQGYGFRSALDVLADAKSRRKEQLLQQTMVEEGYTDPNPLTNDELLDEADEKPLSKEEGDEIRRIVSNFQKKGRKMFSIQDLADAVLDSIGGYGRDGNYRRYTDPVEAENKVRDFNKNHPLRHKFVASTVKGWNRGPDNYIFYRISIKPKTIMSSIESNRTSFDRQLNLRIRNILESMGVSIGALNELERRQMINGVMDTSQANNVVDGVVELIRLAKGDRGELVLPEEFAHFALEALGDNPIVQRLIDLVSNNNFIEEILGDLYLAYQEAYAGDELLMAKEAVGKLLAKHFLNNNPVPSTGWKALFNRVVNAIKNFWSKLTSDRLTRARAELNSEFSNVAEGILEGIYSSVMSVENIRNSSYSSLLFSLEERVNRDRALLKKMVETETKLLLATTRETSFDKDSFRLKELIEQLNKRLLRGEHIEELLGISEYISGALVSLKGIDKRIMDIYKDRDNISKPEEALSVLRDAYYVFTAYKSMLKTISDDLVKSSLEGEERFDNKLIAQIKDAKEIVEKMEGAYRELSVELFSKFLEPFLGKGIRDIYKTKTGENLDISELLEETDHDIGMLSRWLESMSRIDDLPSLLIDSVVKKKKFEARNETIDVAKKIQAAMIKLELTGIKNTDWLFERDSDGNITGNYISDYDVAAYETAKHAKRNEIAEKYKNKNSLKDQRDRELELTDWVDSLTDLINGLRYPKRELYPSSQMAKLTAAQKEYYDTFMEIKTELDKKLPPSTVRSLRSIMIRKDLLERMTKSGSLKNAGSQLVDSIKDTFVRRPDDTDYGEFHKSNTVLDFEGNEMNSLPIYYIKDLEDMSALSLDATSSLTAYAFMVNDYAKMNEVIDALEVGRNVLRNRDIQQREGGKPKSEIVRHMGRTIQNKLFKKGEGTNLVDRLNDYYSMLIYGRYMKDQGDIKGTNILVSKVANFINLATSATTMWLSLFVGTTNALTGAAQMNIEAAANEHFSAKDIANADIKYFRDIPLHLAQLGKRVKTSKLSLIDELFNANQDAEVRYQHSNMDRRNIFSKLFSMETMYFLSTSGEHWMHIRTVLAVMEGYKMKDSRGKEVSLYDALEVSYTDPNDPNKGAKLKLKDGYRKLDGSEFTQDDINEITNRSATINQDLHGVYNKIDRDAFQALAQGRMIEMFRKWMTRSIRRRYGKALYVVELDQEVEGFYRTMGLFALNLLGDMKRMEFFTASKRYNELSRHQKANMRRAAMDVAQALMISSLLSFIDWDDDDDSWIKNALEYQLRRERTELLSVMPLPQGIFEEGWRILQSPMAGMTFISNVADLLLFWTWFDEVSRGRYEGKTKFQKTLMELTPLNKTIYGINHPEERLLFYKRSM